MLIDYSTLNYMFASFELLFDCFISYLYMRVLKLTLGKIIFLQIFSLNFVFRCEASGQNWLGVQMRAALPIADLAVVVRIVK
jgi:hypothetical protein